VITTQQVRIILDRNRNGLDGRPAVAAGGRLDAGLYWDPDARKVVPMEAAGTADKGLVLLSRRLDIGVDELVRSMAMGGGGQTGRPIEYHAGAAADEPAHH
jgi:hypothetical protein